MDKTPARLSARDTRALGLKLARIRKQRKITQSELAERAGLLQKTISTIERGDARTQLRSLFKVLAALNLELSIQPREA